MRLPPALRSGWLFVAVALAALFGLVAGLVIGQATAGAEPGPALLVPSGAPVSGDAAWASDALDDYVAWTSHVAWTAALEARAAAESERASSLWARWGPVNQCEQGGEWHAYGVFGNGLRGGGGLGISDGAWRENGGLAYGPNAAAATPEQQMSVAERILARYGPGAWGCPVAA